ncbi:RNA polymerase, sigma subunit, ECF family [Lishizhenia tianjinensis]|uniref:RNA polymerase, sigma subunit, ECF family n=1 Tax=Lishizhenia tianjinensis TaxID=477690 RepID=A0A1I6XHY9_9FLAO|nr:sigma-70 family RNA polymerase sigma factor [Lishizhenia tianjinensis]SFT37746.1 RNA polymerase, sigma subunit, ECF family [Lishizhenia tianjinensis]
MQELTDQQLVALYLKGKEQAFETLLMRHKDKIYGFVYMKIRDHALSQDIFQDTFVKIVNTLRRGAYNEEGKFLPWAMRIAHNLVIDHFRKANKTRMISESSSKSDEFNIFSVLSLTDKNVEEGLMKDELEQQMVGLIDHLPETQREIVEMRIFKDMSFKDIALEKDISINTALGRMRYAIINLRKMIEKHNLVTEIA